jgi:hypothetical protein
MKTYELTKAEGLAYSTVRLDVTTIKGQKGTGTGFFYQYDYGDRFFMALVTNRHVLQGAKGIRWLM